MAITNQNKRRTMKADLSLNIKAEIIKTDSGYNAIADVFAVAGVGTTKQEALKSLKECLQSTINYCIDNGTLLQVLEEEGFQKRLVLPKSTKERSFTAINYNIPLGNYGKEKQRQHA